MDHGVEAASAEAASTIPPRGSPATEETFAPKQPKAVAPSSASAGSRQEKPDPERNASPADVSAKRKRGKRGGRKGRGNGGDIEPTPERPTGTAVGTSQGPPDRQTGGANARRLGNAKEVSKLSADAKLSQPSYVS